jgi:hypothetical protein
MALRCSISRLSSLVRPTFGVRARRSFSSGQVCDGCHHTQDIVGCSCGDIAGEENTPFPQQDVGVRHNSFPVDEIKYSTNPG